MSRNHRVFRKLVIASLFLLAFSHVSALEIYRPSNFGSMDDIPCLLRICDMDGNDAWDKIIHLDYSWYYDMQTDPHWTHKYYKGCFTGGAVIHLTMQEGTYRISVYTPPENQFGSNVSNTSQWESNEFIYKTGSPALKVIFVSPVANQNGFYTGAWYIDYRAPKYFKWAKPKRNNS
ncbi:MAG: hypothetical protein J5857_09010 [Treponema sp.]|nr:hypothetical protein [Treponema sp.]